MSPYFQKEFDGLPEWLEQEEERLEKEAPEIIKTCLKNNREVHKLGEDDIEAYGSKSPPLKTEAS